MYQKSEKIFLIGQLIGSVAVILFGVIYGLRCLLAGQVFCAVSFAVFAYVCGYRLLLRASVNELREYNGKRHQA